MKRFFLLLIVLLALVLLSGCAKSKFEQTVENVKNIKITVDQDVIKQTQQKIQEVQEELGN